MAHLKAVEDEGHYCAVCKTRTDQIDYAYESGYYQPVWDGSDGYVIMSHHSKSTFCSEAHWAEWVIEKLKRLGHAIDKRNKGTK